MKRLAVPVLMILLWAIPAAAQDVGTRNRLPNGLTVLVVERPAIPIVIVRAWVRAGAVLDPSEKAGLANLTAEVLTRGTKSRSATEIDEAIEFVGGSLGSDGGRDGAVVAVSILKKDLALGLDLLADILMNSSFPPDEVRRKIREVQADLRRSEERPEVVAGRAFHELLFPGHAYGRPVEGTLASLGKIGRDDLADFHARHYRPQETILAVVGDLKRDEILKEIEKRLGGWPRGASPETTVPPAPSAVKPERKLIHRDLTQATVLLGHSSIGRDHPDFYPLLVANYVLGGGSTSRLYRRIREDLGLVYYVGSGLSPGRYGNFFEISLQTKNQSARQAIDEAKLAIRTLRDQGPTPDELTLTKAYLIGSFPLRMDTNAKLADLVLTWEVNALGLDYPTRFRRLIERVTAEDIKRVATTYFLPDALITVVVGNLSQAGLQP
ncbi:MAG: insulinase family protein [Candidatus Rokubacteria bacterium]|nr:insulinase family protein [Candidatus Rokubacteria bacterium]